MERFQRAEARGQIARRLAAHVGDADGEDEAVERAAPAGGDGVYKVFRLLLAKALQGGKLFLRQRVEVGAAMRQPRVDELRGGLVGKGLDVHGVAPGEVGKAHHQLRLAALAVFAEQVRAALHQNAPAGGAEGGLFDVLLPRHVLVHAPHDLGDDLVGAPDPHLRAHAHALAQDVAVVVERGAADGRPRQFHGADDGDGRELARAPQLPVHLFQRGGGFLGLELVGHGPAGELVRVAQPLAHGKVGDLHHRAVDHVVEVGAVFLDLMDDGERFLQRSGALFAGGHGDAVFAQKVEHLPLA